MRYFVSALALSAVFLFYPLEAFPQDNNQPAVTASKSRRKTKVDVKYDKKKELTTVWLRDLILSKNPQGFEQINMSVSFSYPQHTIVKPKTVLIVIYSASMNGTLFDYYRDLAAIADGFRLKMGKMEYSSGQSELTPLRATLSSEFLRLAIPYDDFSRIAKAKVAMVQIGERKYNLSDKQLQSLNDFLELMQQEGQEFKE